MSATTLPPTFMSKPPDLPVDVAEVIIDFVALDVDAQARDRNLRACALTLQSWLPRSRYHLYHTVLIRSTKQRGRLHRIVRGRPEIRECVQVLQTNAVIYQNEPDFVPSLLLLLPNLHTFLIRPSVTYSSTHRWTLDAKTTVIPSVTTLAVWGVGRNSFSAFTRFVSCFPNLRRLSSDCCWTDLDVPTRMQDVGSELRLTTLVASAEDTARGFSLYPRCTAALLRWLRDTSSTAMITCGGISVDGGVSAVVAKEFLAKCPRLRVLSIKVLLDVWDGWDVWESFNEHTVLADTLTLIHNPELRLLRVSKIAFRSLPPLITLLSTISSQHLEEIQITTRDHTISMGMETATIFDSALLALNIPGLRSVILIVGHEVDCAEVGSWFPLLHAQQLLTVVNEENGPREPVELSVTAWSGRVLPA